MCSSIAACHSSSLGTYSYPAGEGAHASRRHFAQVGLDGSQTLGEAVYAAS